MEFDEFKAFGLEVILKVLKKVDNEIKKYRDLEDYEGRPDHTTEEEIEE